MAEQLTDDEIQAASMEAIALVRRLLGKHDDGGRVVFLLLTALQIVHAIAPSESRADVEEKTRKLLEAMYGAPPQAEIIKQGSFALRVRR